MSRIRRPNRLMIAIPHGELMYGRYFAEWTRIAMWLARRGADLVVDIIPETGHGFPDPHNRCVQRAREHKRWRDVDYLVFMEQDHVFPTNVLERVASYEDPIVGAFYCQRLDPFWPVSIVPKPEHWDDPAMWRGEGWARDKQTFAWPSLVREWKRQGDPQQVLALGMGLTAIRRDVLEAFPERPFFHPSGEDDAQGMTFDVIFCRDARRLGFDVYQDFGVELPHITPHPITSEDHERALQRMERAQRPSLMVPPGVSTAADLMVPRQ